MKVLFIGSCAHLREESERTHFVEACREIGAAFARLGAQFILGSSKETTADRYILDGIASVPGVHKVTFFFPEDSGTPELPRDREGTIDAVFKRIRGPWAGMRIRQIQAADGVVTLGGKSGTAQIIHSAIALGVPVLAVASFGGATSDLWSEVKQYYERLTNDNEKIDNLREAWEPGNETIVTGALQELMRRRVFQHTRSQKDSMLFCLTLALLIAWVWLFISPFQPLQASFFALLAVSAFLGNSLRESLWMMNEVGGQMSLAELLAELRAGLILAFCLSLLYFAGSFAFTGDFQAITYTTGPPTAEQMNDYQRVAVTMGLLGVAGGWLLERMALYLEDQFSSRGLFG